MDFKVTLKDKALVRHTFKTLPAIDDLNCQTKCFMEDRCISYTFDERSRKCNLSDSDHIMHPEDLVDKPNAIYRGAEVCLSVIVVFVSCDFIGSKMIGFVIRWRSADRRGGVNC